MVSVSIHRDGTEVEGLQSLADATLNLTPSPHLLFGKELEVNLHDSNSLLPCLRNCSYNDTYLVCYNYLNRGSLVTVTAQLHSLLCQSTRAPLKMVSYTAKAPCISPRDFFWGDLFRLLPKLHKLGNNLSHTNLLI